MANSQRKNASAKKDEDKKIEESAKEQLDEIVEETPPAKINLKDTTKNIKIGDDVIVDVKSNVFGVLVFSGKDGTIRWEKCGETQQLTMRELRAMKASMLKFFEKQWVIILGVNAASDSEAKLGDVYKQLGITRFYENMLEVGSFKNICSWSEKEIAERVKLMNQGVRESLVIALNGFIESGALDSVKKIKAFEDALGVTLTSKE